MCRTSNDRAGTSTGTAAFAAGDEHHVGALQGFLDIRLVILSGLGTALRVGSGAESTAGLVG